MALSSSDLVQRVRDLVMDRAWETSSTTTTTSTTVAVPDGTQWAEGDVGEWQTGAVGGEQFYVRSVSSNDLTVFRGYYGTTAETHTSGDRILKNPQYTIRQIQQAIDKAVRNLWPSVYKTGVADLSGFSSTTVWHDLNTATVGIVGVVQLYGSSDQYAGLYGTRGSLPFQTNFGLPTTLCASGKGIRFPSGLYHATNDIFITDMRLVTGSSDIDNTLFPVDECLVYLAAGNLLQALEIRRVSRGEEADTVGSVSTGTRLQTGAWYTNMGNTKKEELKLKMEEYYSPIRMRR